MPSIVQELLAGLTEGDLRESPEDETWSIVEHICHLRDIEREGYIIRISKMLTEDNPFLNDLDGDKLAIERDYINQNCRAALKDFIEDRAINVLAIQELTPQQLSRTGVFENVGPLSLLELLLKMREHDQGHIDELTELRGKFSMG
jgi:hypothetical protein